MSTHHIACEQCGWWDMGMKYGTLTRCTQCGAAINPVSKESSPIIEFKPTPRQDNTVSLIELALLACRN